MTARVGPVIVAATGLALLAWTWRAWPDPLVDFGRELYVPWRLAEGDALFRDVLRHGPTPVRLGHEVDRAALGDPLRSDLEEHDEASPVTRA